LFHPDVELRIVDPLVGRGLFATRAIPMGTVTWVFCALEQVLDPLGYSLLSAPYRSYLDKYSYATRSGERILCCDLGRYINHSCEPNTLTLRNAEIELAIRDIQPGEELTDDYGTFRTEDMVCRCGQRSCRGVVRGDDWDRHGRRWSRAVERAAEQAVRVPQPLAPFLPAWFTTRAPGAPSRTPGLPTGAR
jgi:hypothetical protein